MLTCFVGHSEAETRSKRPFFLFALLHSAAGFSALPFGLRWLMTTSCASRLDCVGPSASFACTICDSEFSTRNTLFRHIREQHYPSHGEQNTRQSLMVDPSKLLRNLGGVCMLHAEQSCTQHIFRYLLPLDWLPDSNSIMSWYRSGRPRPTPPILKAMKDVLRQIRKSARFLKRKSLWCVGTQGTSLLLPKWKHSNF